MSVNKIKLEAARPSYVKISEHKPGDTLVIGDYLGMKIVPGFNGEGTASLHSFNTDGGEVRLNGNRTLDSILGTVEAGTTIEIVYTGKEPGVSKDGKKFKRNTFEVSKLSKVS